MQKPSPHGGPLKILCISGSGRSGTTILSVLLSQNEDIFNLGQSRDFWVSYAAGAMCTCDKPLNQCDVWSRVVQTGFGGWTTNELRDVRKTARIFGSEASELLSWRKSDELEALAARHSGYLDLLGRFLEASQEVTGCNIFVDSSKSPEMALAYSLLDNVEVYVVNLVRDPRAVLTSWTKKLGDERKALKYCDVWVDRQRRLEEWGQILASNYRRLSYEALVKRPREEIMALLSWIGSDSSASFFTGPDQAVISWDRQHLFPPANEKVLADRHTSVKISAPSEWKSPKNWRTQWRALVRTFPSGPRYVLRTAFRRY